MEATPEEVAAADACSPRSGFALALVGVIELIFVRDLLVLWIFLIAFGLARSFPALCSLRSFCTGASPWLDAEKTSASTGR